MNKINKILSLVVLQLLFVKIDLNAQSPILSSSHKQVIYTSFGIDPALVTTLGYARRINTNSFVKEMLLSTEISIPIQFDFNDYRLKLGGQMNLFEYGKLYGWGILSLIDRNTRNSIHQANSLGIEITLLSGLHGKHYFLLGELGYDKSFFTHIKHNDWYKEYYYSDAKDGWYRNSAHHFNLGINAGFSLSKFVIMLRTGIQKSKSIIDPLVPFYGIISLNYRF